MCVEVPVLKRFCFCLSLRCGLILWGLFKMLTISLWLGYYSFFLNKLVNLNGEQKETISTKNLILSCVTISSIVTEIILHAILVVGAHKKYIFLLKIYYYYALTLVVITTVLGIVNLDLMLRNVVKDDTENLWIPFVVKTTFMAVNLFIQAYIILIVRSYIIRLANMGSLELGLSHSAVTLQCESILIQKERPTVINQERKNDIV